jgi:hypothetical protein
VGVWVGDRFLAWGLWRVRAASAIGGVGGMKGAAPSSALVQVRSSIARPALPTSPGCAQSFVVLIE